MNLDSKVSRNEFQRNWLETNMFEGFVQSDWQAQHAGVSAVLAGLDMSMPGDTVFDSGVSYIGPNLTISVLNGSIPQWRVDDMATRILAGWYFVDGEEKQKSPNFNSWTLDTYGPFHSYVGGEWGYGLINEHVDVRQGHGRLIREIGAASTVLLKNKNNVLPLTGHEKLTTVFGEDAGSNLWGPNGCADRGCDQGTLGIGWVSQKMTLSVESGWANRSLSHRALVLETTHT